MGQLRAAGLGWAARAPCMQLCVHGPRRGRGLCIPSPSGLKVQPQVALEHPWAIERALSASALVLKVKGPNSNRRPHPWFYGVTVSTFGFDPNNPGSIPGRT